MPTTVVVGGQFGSEGKGKVCAHLALRGDADIMVRCGGPNSGHTVQTKQQTHRLRQIPSGFINPDTMLMIAPGALLDPRIFLREVQNTGSARNASTSTRTRPSSRNPTWRPSLS